MLLANCAPLWCQSVGTKSLARHAVNTRREYAPPLYAVPATPIAMGIAFWETFNSFSWWDSPCCISCLDSSKEILTRTCWMQQ